MCTLYVPLVLPSSLGGWLRLLLIDCGVHRVNWIPPMSHTHTITFTQSPLPASISWCHFKFSNDKLLLCPLHSSMVLCWRVSLTCVVKGVTDLCCNEKYNMLERYKNLIYNSNQHKNFISWIYKGLKIVLTADPAIFKRPVSLPPPPTCPPTPPPPNILIAKFLGWR